MRKTAIFSIFFIGILLLMGFENSYGKHFPIAGSIGEKIQAAQGIVYIEEMKEKSTSEGAKIIEITFTFKSSEDRIWSPPLGYWELIDDKGNVHDPLDEWYPITPLPKGDISRGSFQFVIGENVNPSVLAFKESVNFDSEINIDLTKNTSVVDPVPTSEYVTCNENGITNGDFELNIINRKAIQTNPFIYDIEISIENISEKTQSLTDFELKDEKGNLAEYDFQNSNFNGREIFPGQSVTGNIAFTFYTVPEKVMLIMYETGSKPLILHTGYCSVSESVETKLQTTELENDSEDIPKVPKWVRNTALWYGQGQISEDEFLNAIKFLIKEGIILVE